MTDCGVAAVVCKQASDKFAAYRALQSLLQGLQHRGPLGCGVGIFDEDSNLLEQQKNLGLVQHVLDGEPMHGSKGLGMVRYGTSGFASEGSSHPLSRAVFREKILEEQQPFHHRDRNPWWEFCVAFNGQLTNDGALRTSFRDNFVRFKTMTDTEVLEVVIADELKKAGTCNQDLMTVFSNVAKSIEGCYNIVFIDGTGRIAALRDPHEFRPFVYADTADYFVIASETGALENLFDINKHSVDFINPGELLIYDNGLSKHQIAVPDSRMCLFEFIYFMNVVNRLPNNASAFSIRRMVGKEMAGIEPLRDKNDFSEYLVVAVPDTARTAAHSFASELSLELDGDGIVKDPFAGRAFLQDPTIRQHRLSIKYKVIPEVVRGRKVIVFDDSIVRGDASLEIVKRLFSAGAKEVHFRVSYSPILHPCFYGIDFPVQAKLLAYRIGFNDALPELEAKVAKEIHADSFKYPPLDVLLRVVAKAMGRNVTEYCHACMSGRYPIE